MTDDDIGNEHRSESNSKKFLIAAAITIVLLVLAVGYLLLDRKDNEENAANKDTTTTAAFAASDNTAKVTSTTRAGSKAELVIDDASKKEQTAMNDYAAEKELDYSKYGFQTANGTVKCTYLDDRGAIACYVQEPKYDVAPRSSSCRENVEWRSEYTLVHTNGDPVITGLCTGYPVHNPDGNKVLAESKAVVEGPISCIATGESMSCVNKESRHGFTVSKNKRVVY